MAAPPGAPRGHGAVFKVTQDGAEKVVYGFKSSLDGAEPFAGLLKVGALLYGTTYLGGRESAVSQGTVFKVSPGGTEAVLHYFSSVEADGAYPNAGLINVGGTLYGTTSRGGAFGLGAVFRITPAGAEKLVYSFKGGSDGATPAAGLLNVDGVLFGTTSSAARVATAAAARCSS